MNQLNRIHEDWKKIIPPLIYQEDLAELFSKILPENHYKPHFNDILQMFEMSPKEIKVIMFLSEDHLLYSKENHQELRKQGVFVLYSSLTASHTEKHAKYWEKLINHVIQFMSKNYPCIWIIANPTISKFLLQISNKYLVQGYDKDTIEDIPINPDWNYVFTIPNKEVEGETSKHNYYINSILKHKSLKEIKC